MSSIWDIQRNFLPSFTFLPILQTGEVITEPFVVRLLLLTE